jgi:molybdopterin/thiamine biosynthesis adenylyltransferase
MTTEAKGVDKRFERHMTIVDPEKLAKARIIMVGLGSFGSWALLNLVKIGCRQIVAYDFDVVDIQNYSNQFYWEEHVGKKKTAVMRSVCSAHGADVMFIDGKFEGGLTKAEIIISAVDNMKARNLLWKSARDSIHTQLYIDARMAGTEVQCFAIQSKDPEDIDFFENKDAEFLFEDTNKDIEPLKCTEKGIIFGAQMGALHIANAVAAHVGGFIDRYPRFIGYDLRWTYLPVIYPRKAKKDA